ncbi:flavodoxin [Metamycoplasma arthritidis]|nr:flavodoxin [Metamycoplasma arthritidis]VEU79095.1 flavodoxin [Metamycoplasma arthritidis]
MMNKALVVYFSATGLTRKVAEEIVKTTGAQLEEIVPLEKYSDDDLTWTNPNSRASIEHKNPQMRPKIQLPLVNLDDYEIIYLGFPIWWGIAPAVVFSFLEMFNLANKKFMVFCTSGSSNALSAVADLNEKYPQANWISAMRFGYGFTNRHIKQWIEDNLK